MADGGRLSKAKLFYNAIRPALLSVPIDHVCLPALHLDLGIYLWVFDSLDKACKHIDLKMACEVEASEADSAALESDFEEEWPQVIIISSDDEADEEEPPQQLKS